MRRRSPTLEGFAAMFRDPALGLAEIAWRWTFGFAASATLLFSFVQYLESLPVTDRDLFFLRTGQRFLMAQALARIFQGSASRLALAAAILLPTLAIAWILIGSFGRAVTLRALIGYFRDEESQGDAAKSPVLSLFGLNLLRATAALAAVMCCAGAFLLAGAASPKTNPSPGSAFVIFVFLVLTVWLVWGVANWLLSLSSVFVVDAGLDTFGAIAAAVELCRNRTASVAAAGAWFGLAHVTAFSVATSVVAFPLAFLGVLPAGVVLGGVLIVTLLYFAVADFLYVGRLAAYVAIMELPLTNDAITPLPPPVPPLATTIDKDELILSDAESAQAPALSAEPMAGIDKGEQILSDIPNPEIPGQPSSWRE